MIFVFGSNLGGIHGAGAARTALLNHGAVMGKSVGPYGNSYAIPTKSVAMRGGKLTVAGTLSIRQIKAYVDMFLLYAKTHPDQTYQVTRIGCGLAGLKDEDIAPLFESATPNCLFDTAWIPFLTEDHRFWGTF